MQGTRCDSNNSGCGWQYTLAALQNGSNYILHGYVIQPGDKLLVRQYQPTGVQGGVGLYFINGYATWDYGVLYDQDGQSSIQDAVVNTWHSRRFDLTQFAGRAVDEAVTITEGGTLPGPWSIYYQDFVLLSADGTVHKIYSRDKSVSAYLWGSAGMTGTSATVNHSGGEGAHQAVTTTYYHGDHLGSSRLLSSADGYPTWQGTYYPYGMEYTPPGSTDNTATVNHYKFTGKERDAESGLDYFGARYYSSITSRWLTPDWSAAPVPLPYADLHDPQTLNLYGYVRNNPLSRADKDGHCAEDFCIVEGGAAVYVAGAALVAGTAAVLSTPAGQRSLSTFTSAASTSISNSIHTITSFFSKSKDTTTPAPAVPTAGQSKPGDATAPVVPGTQSTPRSNPMTGEPGSTSQTTQPDGTPKQVRRYGPDGHPETDVDHGHDHGQGDPHSHDWGRPQDGSPPTHVDRAPGRPVKPEDPKPQ